jgi:6,7-dimethyl-8-ribityllumazine synthase
MAEHQRKSATPPRLPGARFLVVEARYYDAVGELLLAGARAAFAAAAAEFDVISAPGALEIPAATAIALDAAGPRAAPMTAPSRSAASSAARPFISRSSPGNRRAR